MTVATPATAPGPTKATAPNAKAGKGGWSRRNYAPVLYLFIEGKDASDLLKYCTKFTYKRSQDKAAETTFEFRNDNRKLLDDPRLFPNRKWQFRFGFYDDMSPIHSGVIRAVAPEYADKRTVKITVVDATAIVGANSSQKNWGTITSTEIARAIAKKHNLGFSGDDSKDKPKKAFIQPGNTNDIQYLRDLAAEIAFEVFVAGTPQVLYYRKKPYDAAPRATLTYYDDPTEFSYVKNFKPKIDMKGVSGASGVSGATTGPGGAAGAKKKAGKEADLAKTVVDINGGTGQATAYVPPPSRDANKGVTKPTPNGGGSGGLAAAARSQQLDKVNEADSDHPLTAAIEPGNSYEWRGIEKQLNGKWYCNEITCEISGTGASTKATWKRNSSNGKGAGSGNGANNKDPKKAGGDGPATVVDVNGGTGQSTAYTKADPPKGKK